MASIPTTGRWFSKTPTPARSFSPARRSPAHARSIGKHRPVCRPTRWWWSKYPATRTRSGRGRGARSTRRAGWKSSTSATAVVRPSGQSSRLTTSVADETFVAHQEVGEEAVVRNVGGGGVGGMPAAVHVGDGRLGEQIVDQVFVVGDRADHQRMPQRLQPIGPRPRRYPNAGERQFDVQFGDIGFRQQVYGRA